MQIILRRSASSVSIFHPVDKSAKSTLDKVQDEEHEAHLTMAIHEVRLAGGNDGLDAEGKADDNKRTSY